MADVADSELEKWSESELYAVWCASKTEIDRTVGAARAVTAARARQLLLAEIERRYPTQTCAWLSSDAALTGEPPHFLRTNTASTVCSRPSASCNSTARFTNVSATDNPTASGSGLSGSRTQALHSIQTAPRLLLARHVIHAATRRRRCRDPLSVDDRRRRHRGRRSGHGGSSRCHEF